MSCQIQATSNGFFFSVSQDNLFDKSARGVRIQSWHLSLATPPFLLGAFAVCSTPSTPFLPATQGTFTFARGGGGWRLLRPFSLPYPFLSFSSIFPCSVRSRRKIEKCAFGILRPKNVEMYFSGEIYSTYLGIEVRVGGSVG